MSHDNALFQCLKARYRLLMKCIPCFCTPFVADIGSPVENGFITLDMDDQGVVLVHYRLRNITKLWGNVFGSIRLV